MNKNYAVITGASSGLGVEFAKQLAKEGYKLILVARRKERLVKLAKQLPTRCVVVVADLSKEADCRYLWRKICRVKVDIFINNAGFGDCGCFSETSLKKDRDMIKVNVQAVHYFMKKMLHRMTKLNHGYILNVGSSAGLMPAGPYMANYYATKAYVVSLTQAVARELKEQKSDVYVGCLCPGPVETEFNHVANVEFSLPGIDVKKCVSYAIRKMKRGKVVIVPGLIMKASVAGAHVLSRKKTIKIVAQMQKKKMVD